MKTKVIHTLITIFSLTAVIHATTIPELTLEELVLNSTNIILAKVVSSHSYQNDHPSRVYTDITLEVDKSYKGTLPSGENLTITMYGGTLNGYTTILVGAPSFQIGQSSVLFLRKIEAPPPEKAHYGVIGLFQGKYDVTVDKHTGSQVVMRNNNPIPLKIGKNGNKINLTKSAPITLSQFITYVRKYIQ